MFEGTLRENIDPVGEHQDADIWAALEHSHLKAYVESLPEGLDAPVQEGGSSLSSGQRQLLCFARALLRKSKVLVLDEATSAVDLDTDRAIQEIIRGPIFHDVTILTIAHRLNTIIESDRVLVLEQGNVAEFEAPEVLLADKTSRFYSMALEAGLVQDTVREDGGVQDTAREDGGWLERLAEVVVTAVDEVREVLHGVEQDVREEVREVLHPAEAEAKEN
ncbi:hypothetical protein PAXINDRAFT_20611 [Paxillus involutus ATCC 200175]|uniref:ABC transporter domain-containing protein n=1 Tax=Paxillus involutus ATCC 200175 TaxID=664439 RepID=A0A0C9SUQ7_PAXIN|nr:hypothetical protein PAXINDRAFT_20611 [Paxillus involutus ATCC 200175]